MKKITALILTFVFLFSMASCHKKDAETTVSIPSASTDFATEFISESLSESETLSVTQSSKHETTEKRSASAASTTKKKKTTAASTLKTTVTEISETIITTAKRRKKFTTRRNYFPETSSAASTASVTSATTYVTVTETEVPTTEASSETEEDEETPVYRPVQRPESTTAAKKHCTISITCAEIIKNKNKLKSGKEAFVPSDGEILKSVTVEFEDGETVFDILCRACEANSCTDNCQYCRNGGIQLEYEYTPGYENYYIEGIHQIYEKDCGSKSGWMYKVNGVFPNYGCSEYTLKDGDKIEFIYTCDLGEDIGADF